MRYDQRYMSSVEALMAGNPIAGRLTRMAPMYRGAASADHQGKSCFVRCARMILVVMRPNTKLIVTANRTRWLSLRMEEFGDQTHATVAAVTTNITDSCKNAGLRGRFCCRRAFATFNRQPGAWPKTNEVASTKTKTSWNVQSPKSQGRPRVSTARCSYIWGPQTPDAMIIHVATMRPSVGPLT